MHPVATRLHGALTRRPWVAPTALALLAGVVLLTRLGTPGRIIFDETYYVGDALGYLETGVEPGFAVHPTLGKWLIAGSILLLGDDPVGWRAAGALAGVATVVVTYLLARRLLREDQSGWWLALLAPVLLLADGLFLTQSRIAMLDVFLVLFAITGLWVLVIDRDRRRAGRTRPWRPSLRMLAGAMFGLAIAVKWSGLLALGGAGLLTIGWELGAALRPTARPGPDGGEPAVGWGSVPRRAAAVVGSLVLVPVLVYLATWGPWLAQFENSHTAGCVDQDATACTFTLGERLEGLVRHHDAMAGFHLGLEATHSYRSDPLGWVVLQRPVVYYWATCSEEDAAATPTIDPDSGELEPGCEVPVGAAGEVLSMGNPALWWGFLLLTPVLVAGTVTRDRRSAVPLVGWLATWLPWLLVSRTAFLFYLAPAVPLLAIGTVVAAQRLGARVPVLRTYVGAVVGAAAGLALTGTLALLDVVAGVRVLALAGGLGWTLGAVLGAVADRVTDRSVGGPGAPARRVTTGRWALAATLVTLAAAVWFAPVWLGIPIDDETIRLRWWFDSWI